MVLGWLRRRRRRQLRMRPFPEDWLAILRRNVYCFARLSESEQRKLLGDVQVLVAEKNWEGCGGLRITDEVKVTVAAQACLLVLAFVDEYFDLAESILVYPDAYAAPGRAEIGGGVVLEGKSFREGEAWYRGPIILSWADALAGARHETRGHNLVLHEFAHQLDMQNGRQADGVPPLATPAEDARWRQVLGVEFEKLQRACEERRPALLDCYGATEPSEFFAVATECFFELPLALAEQHAALYAILRDFYRQDPAERC